MNIAAIYTFVKDRIRYHEMQINHMGTKLDHTARAIFMSSHIGALDTLRDLDRMMKDINPTSVQKQEIADDLFDDLKKENPGFEERMDQ